MYSALVQKTVSDAQHEENIWGHELVVDPVHGISRQAEKLRRPGGATLPRSNLDPCCSRLLITLVFVRLSCNAC